MRLLVLLGAGALAACGGETEQKAKAPPPPQALQAGQWESSLEVTNLRKLDQGEPRLDMPAGTRATGGACIGAADASRPPPELFVGSGFDDCSWGENFYLRNGRLVASATCRRDGVGEVDVTVNVDFTETSFEGTTEFGTRLPTDGDVHVAARVNGRRTGQCTPAAADGNQTKAE